MTCPIWESSKRDTKQENRTHHAFLSLWTGMDILPPEIWRRIFEYDPTYHRIFQEEVIPALHRSHTEFMSEMFFHFFWDRHEIVTIIINQRHFEIHDIHQTRYTIEYMNEHSRITYRIHNQQTGVWYDECLE